MTAGEEILEIVELYFKQYKDLGQNSIFLFKVTCIKTMEVALILRLLILAVIFSRTSAIAGESCTRLVMDSCCVSPSILYKILYAR